MQSKLWGEAIGTFALTFIGAGAIMTGGDLLTVALAHGVVLAIVVSATMNVSGGHINPAVTLSMMVCGKMDNDTGVKYIVSQCIGALVAGGALYMLHAHSGMTWGSGAGELGTPAPAEGLSTAALILTEAALTFLLLFAIWGTAVDPRAPAIAGWGIGMMVAVDIMMGGGITGAAMNPARHLGTAFFAGGEHIKNIVYYVGGPVLGAVMASWLYDNFLMSPEDDDAKLSDHDA